MSRYAPLWKWLRENGRTPVTLTFEEIEKIAGFPLDHSFLTFKKELAEYGWKVVKISLKSSTVSFEKLA